MSLIHWIKRCNTFDPTFYLPFVIEQKVVGWIKKEHLDTLADFPQVFRSEQKQVEFHPLLANVQARTQAVAEVLESPKFKRLLPPLFNEYYPVAPYYQETPLMNLERGAVPFFGVRAYGIHLNGLVRKQGQVWMWIARRALDRTAYPGYLDNLVAGGQSVGYSAQETLLKECLEEANIPLELSCQATAVSAFNYNMMTNLGVRRDTIFNYDLWLPEDFQPVNTDGEVEEFYLWPIEEVLAKVKHTLEFKTNCNLVIIDFLLRFGYITPSDPEYMWLINGLHPAL